MASTGEDDSVEMEIVAGEPDPPPAAAPKRPRRRTPNPTADQVVHTGEIAPRSSIIRSGEHAIVSDSQPKIEINLEPEPPKAAPVLPTKPQARLWIWIAAGLTVAAGLAVAFVVTRNKAAPAAPTRSSGGDTGASGAALEATSQFIGMTLDGEAQAASTRAEAMASSPMLKAGIETDTQTLADQVKDNDVTFTIKAGEVIAIYRRLDGKLSPMLMMPNDAAPITPPTSGKPQISTDRNGLVVVASAPIMTSAGERGVLVLAVPINLDGIRKRLEPHVKQASLVGGGAPLPLVQGPSNGTKVSIPIKSDSGAALRLEAIVAGP